jgi:hypothetical protein
MAGIFPVQAARNALHVSILTDLGGHALPPAPRLPVARRVCAEYVAQSFIPRVCGTREQAKAAYGEVKLLFARLRDLVVNPHSGWHDQNPVTVCLFAMMGGLALIVMCVLKSRQQVIKEILPLMKPSLTNALFYNGSLLMAVLEVCTELTEYCFDPSDLPGQGSLQYVLSHPHCLPKDFYPGSCHRHQRRGRMRGLPRWPFRFAGHHQATGSGMHKDYNLARHVKWRKTDPRLVFGMPTFTGTDGEAYSREQHIIRERHPRTTGKHLNEMHRQGRERAPRGRRGQADRRRDRQAQGARPRIPRLEDNMHTSRFYLKQWATSEFYTLPVRNFTTLYWYRQRTLAGLGVLAMGPLQLDDTQLRAEYAATPGKRLDPHVQALSDAELMAIGTWIPKIRSEYRRELLSRRVSFFMHSRYLPKPIPHRIGIPDTIRGARQIMERLLAWGIAETRECEPERAAYANMYTRIGSGRCPKYTDGWVTEKWGSLEYSAERTGVVPAEWKEQLVNGWGSQV